MRIFYSLGINIYYLLILIASLWNRKARLWIRGRKDWERQLEEKFSKSDQVVWFHCASLGEFEQGRPLMEKVKSRFPDYKILLTFFSPSGYEKRKDFEGADVVIYLPLDTHRNAMRMLELVPVNKVFFIKYEFWYHFLAALHQRDIPVYLASGIFRADQLFFRSYGGWYRKFLHKFTHIFVQNISSEQLLRRSGITRVSVAGDTRFERVQAIAEQPGALDNLQQFSVDNPLIVAGSTWEKDEELILEAYGKLPEKYGWIIAPHEPDQKHIQHLAGQFPDHMMFSDVLRGNSIHARVIIVDTIGHLSSLYRYATVSFIGGGFGKGIHNILEAAAFGKAVLFGPNFERFQEATDLVSAGAAYVVKEGDEVALIINDIVESKKRQQKIADIADNYIKMHTGASERIIESAFSMSK